MQSLEAAYKEGEVTPSLCDCLYKMVCTHNKPYKKAKLSSPRSSLSLFQEPNVPTFNDSPNTSAYFTAPSKPQFCIHSKLLELYLEECAKDANKFKTGLKCNTHLLEKLVARERLNTIILNLYPGNKGYSITFPTSPQSDACTADTAEMIESKMWPYEDSELLRYLDLEELPAFIVDLLEPQHSFLFYSGCIIAQVRDYRQAFPTLKYNTHHVLLKPTQQSILADVNKIAEDWKADDKAQLESQILLANHPTLCLESSATLLTAQTSRIHHNRHILNTHRIRRAAMKYSQVTANRKKKLMPHTYRPGLELYEYLNRLRTRPKTGLPLSKIPKRPHEDIRPIPAPRMEPSTIEPPTQAVNINEFKAYALPRDLKGTADSVDCQPQLVEEYVLETDMHSKEADKGRVYHIKLSILQRPLNGEYLGELYLDRDHKKGERNGVAYRFSLGTRVQANRYVQQFTEIITEGGRKPVRVNYCFAQTHTPQVEHPPTNLPQQNISLSYQTLSGANSVVNGTVNLVSAQQSASASVPILQAQLQTNKQTQDVNTEHAFNILAAKRMNSVQQIQAANSKQHLQNQKSATCRNPAIINILNSSPASNINSDAVVNAINNSQLLTQQPVQAKLLGRKFTVSNMPANACVLNATNVISVNNKSNITDLTGLQNQQQQITLTTVGSSNFFTTVPKQTQQSPRTNTNDGLSALLVGTPSADRPDIIGTSTNSLLLEKLGGATSSSSKSPTFIQSSKQYTAVQSPKISPLSSPPPQTTQTINVQSLNFTPIHSLQGLQNVQFLSLHASSTGSLQGQSLLVSVPVTSTTNSAASGTGMTQCVNNNNNSNLGSSISVGNVGTSTVVLATNSGTSNLAQLVRSGVKRAGTQGTVLAQNSTSLQLVTPIQRSRQIQQQAQQLQQQSRVQQLQQMQRHTPITIKMATPGSQPTNVAQNVVQQVQLQLTNQQQYHLSQSSSQPQHSHLNKITRRSSQNVSDPP